MALTVSRTPQRGVELGYAQITSDFSTANTSATDVTGLTTTVTVGPRPIIVRFCSGKVGNTSATGGWAVQIVEGATVLYIALVNIPAGAASRGFPTYIQARIAPSAGEHTYKITLHAETTGTATIAAAATAPAHIQVVEC